MHPLPSTEIMPPQKRRSHVQVANELDVYVAGEAARNLALAAGFADASAHEISLCAVELAMNMVLHAHGGVLTIDSLTKTDRPGIFLIAEDDGRNPDLHQDMVGDGMTTRSSLGYGLGTVNRLMDSLKIDSPRTARGGTRVTGFKALPASIADLSGFPLEVGIASRPCPGFEQNGDAYVQHLGPGFLLAGVIDGLGHGQFAAKASASARNYVMGHADNDLQDIFAGASRMCLGTRGAAMTLARLKWGDRTMVLAGKGNVDVRFPEGHPEGSFVPARGFVGKDNSGVQMRTFVWGERLCVLIYSDGISSACTEVFRDASAMSAQDIASTILMRHARSNDDATILVIREKRSRDA